MNIKKTVGAAYYRMSRPVRTAVVVLAVTAGTLVGTAGVAHADFWSLSDGFDLNPSTTWRLETYGASSGGLELNAGTARSAPNNAWLRSTTSFSAWGRNTRITPTRYGPTCSAQIYVQTPGGATVNFEVINPVTFNYIRLTTATPASTGSGWTKLTTTSWKPGLEGGENVLIRIALVGNGTAKWIRADDMSVSCSGYYAS